MVHIQCQTIARYKNCTPAVLGESANHIFSSSRMAAPDPHVGGEATPVTLASAHNELMQRMHEEVQEDVLRELARQDMQQRNELKKRAREQASSARSVMPLVIRKHAEFEYPSY